MRLHRRTLLGGAAAMAAAGCMRPALDPLAEVPVQWVGHGEARGHRLRAAPPSWPSGAARSASVLVLGGGIAGLAAARTLAARGIDDVQLLELEDAAGGHSRAHAIDGIACPMGAHYLPVPGPQAHEVSELLHELGLLRQVAGRSVPDERHLCHSPQERLFIDGAWVDGLLPPAEPGSRTLAQYRAFAAEVAAAQRGVGFALPTSRARWTPAHDELDAQTFAAWLEARGFDDARLRWALDYACRDDYGAGASTVSAWAGLHYFGSRHGFHVPGDEADARDPVFTWPQGNGWLVERMAVPLADRIHTGRTVLQVRETRHAVEVLAWNEREDRAERWQAQRVVMALPLFVAARVLQAPPPALAAAVAAQPRAPWLVAHLHLRAPLVDRLVGAAPAWDNVRFGGDPRALGYVDAMHQGLRSGPGPTVLSVYWALPVSQRADLLRGDARAWLRRVVEDLAPVHPDLPAALHGAELVRHGHAMSIPVPGLRGSAALAALRGEGRAGRSRLHFAHADVAGYSVFEEAYTLGVHAGRRA